MASAIQLNFTLRTSSNCKTVHLIGSWDGYRGQLPLSKDTTKSGGWKGVFRFQDTVLKQGQRYWYYYIIDGYHVSHDPARDSVTEPTTGRKLNVLDIPHQKGASTTAPTGKSSREAARHSRRPSAICVKGRPLSVSEIQSPRPRKPGETRQIRTEQFRNPTLDQLSAKFAASQLDDDDDDSDEGDSEIENNSDSGSDISSDVPSLTSRSSRSSGSSGASSPSSVSSSSSCCTCERYGITRSGARVKLDCGGRQCGYSDGSECSSDSDSEYRRGMTRRNGIVVRHQ